MSCHISINMGTGAKCCVHGLVKMLRFFYVSSFWFRAVLYEMVFITIKAFVRGFDLLIWALQSMVSYDFEW